MKNERQIAELIFDAFRQTNCRAGHIVMMRTFRFGIEMNLNPIEKDKYACVLTALINLHYVDYENDHIECLRLTEKGYNYIYDDEKVEKMQNVPWLLPLLENSNWGKAFEKLYSILTEPNNPYKLEWNNFFEWINACNSDNPISNERKASIMGSRENQKNQAFELVESLPDNNAKMTFYLYAQNYCESKILED